MKHQAKKRSRSTRSNNTATFECDLSQHSTPFLHAWEHTVGSGHAPSCLRADWQQQLTRCQKELGVKYARFRALLSDETGTLVREKGELLYCFFNADQIFDFLRSINVRPFVELSFMPRAIAAIRCTTNRSPLRTRRK